MTTLQLTTFRADITPPIGHPLCGGWYEKPATGITDNLSALGVVLIPDGQKPVVLCALDWCEISHADHLLWRTRLADAASTTPDRVAVQCVHSHEVPWPDREAQSLLDQHRSAARVMDVAFCDDAIERATRAARAALSNPRTVTHIGIGEAKVDRVASNRRILGPDGKIKAIRWTATKDPAVRAEPEGLIDPMLKTVSFWNGETKLAALHYYATHPNSYGGNGWVTKDFAGLARERRQAEDMGAAHVYFTGCGGNVTAGKYNDGAPENRAVLAARIHAGLAESERRVERVAAGDFEWRTAPVFLPPREDMNETDLLKAIPDRSQSPSQRIKAAMKLAYLRQTERRDPTPLAALHLGGKVCILHLPGESFIEYQLFAQSLCPDHFVAVASYGDCSTGYIPMTKSYEEGGYEPTDSFVSPQSEPLMKEAITACLERHS